MKKNFEKKILFIFISILLVTNLNLLVCYKHELAYKRQVAELTRKQQLTSSMALQTIYADSINNTIKLWLEDGTD